MSDKAEQAKVISESIKAFRNSLGWNQARLAEEAGISGAALSKIEQGSGRVPTIVVLRKLASALKVTVNEITGDQDESTSENSQRSVQFYRKFGVIDELSEGDQKRLLEIAERLKEITPNDS